MLRLLLLMISILILSLSTVAEEDKGLDQIRHNIESSNEQAMRDWVKMSCIGSYRTDVMYPHFSSDAAYALIQVSSYQCDTMALILFERRSKNEWNYLQTVHLSARYTTPAIRLVEVAEAGKNDVLVEHQTVDWGTGVMQRNISLYHMSNNRLACVLDEPEYVLFAAGGPQGKSEFSQQGRFEVRLSSPDTSGHQYLHEEQTIKVGGISVSRSRNCLWEEKAQHMRCVEAAGSGRAESNARP